MSEPNARELLLRVLSGEKTERPPVVCPGGMMNNAIVEIMDRVGAPWPLAHSSAAAMASLAAAGHEVAHLDNAGVPFCMTVEAEALGATIDLGDKTTEPRVVGYPYATLEEAAGAPWAGFLDRGRIPVVLDAIAELAHRLPDAPVVGNLTGPISLACSLVDPLVVLRAARREPQNLRALLERIADALVAFARAQVKAGACVLCLADPSGTGEILGPRAFRELSVPVISRIIAALEGAAGGSKVPVILHICGRLGAVKEVLHSVSAAAVSVDSCESLASLRRSLPNHPLMGNVSTFTLEKGTPEQVAQAALECRRRGADVIAPACGIGPRTPLANVRAMVEGARRGLPAWPQ